MIRSEHFLQLLRCPVSKLPLNHTDNLLLTTDGAHAYPIVNGIPWLLAHPRNSLLDWGAKLKHFQQVLLSEITQLELDANDNVHASGFSRLESLLLAKKDFLLEMTRLMQPLVETKVAPMAVYSALRDRAPNTQNLLSYEANIYRDWQWGHEENQLSCELVQRLMPVRPGKFLVLGAGACRLALDLHSQCDTSLTVATDINPLFLLAVKRLLDGDPFLLTEFPLQPKLMDYVAIKHQMAAPANLRRDNFFLSFADAAKPPFAPAAFNTVLTPWLIDVQPHAFRLFLRQLNYYLPVGGHWLNFGSLVFNQRREALCYSSDEVVELAAEAGFEILDMQQEEIPYLKSPYNAGYRVETVWLWRAVKRSDVAAQEDVQVLPDWLLDTSKPVPRTADLQHLETQHHFLADLHQQIDGARSLKHIARYFARRDDSDADEFERMLVNYFADMQGRF